MKRYLFVTILWAILLSMLAACSGPQTAETSNPAPPPANNPPASEVFVSPAPAVESPEPPPVVPIEPINSSEPESELCPEIPRPAVALFVLGEGYRITNPLSGDHCYTDLDGEESGRFQAANKTVYYGVLQADRFVVKQLGQNGVIAALPFTAVARDDALLQHSFVVSADGRYIAWSAASAGPNYDQPPVSQMWLAGIEGNEVVSPPPEFRSQGDMTRALAPVRFSEDNSVLYYTVQPIGLGGVWSSFNGRYDNLYALRLASAAGPVLIFDCADHDLFLCIGDFYEADGEVRSLAYVEGKTVMVLNSFGAVANTFTADADYIGFPTFGPGNELVYYTADLSQRSIAPEQGTIHYAAPGSATSKELASDPGLLAPYGWLDARHLVVGYSQVGESWGTAVLSLDGQWQPLELEADTHFIAVLPAQ